jgi:solute carrier family 6 serotonin transporter-like protein 4
LFCFFFSGIGFGICIIATYVSWYYNTIISWALFYFFSSMRADVPWKTCNNTWNTNMCMDSEQRRAFFAARKNVSEELVKKEVMNYTTPNEEFFE